MLRSTDLKIMLAASSASQVANNAFLKLCRMDVASETEKWARTAPKFALDGRVAVVTVDSGFQGGSLPILSLFTRMTANNCSSSGDCYALGWESREEEQEADHGHGTLSSHSFPHPSAGH